MKILLPFIVITVVASLFLLLSSPQDSNNDENSTAAPVPSLQVAESDKPAYEYATFTEVTVPEGKEIATFAGGCFWCVEAVFQETDGVDNVISGYAGGTEVDPAYNDVAGGLTSHREAIQFTYDPTIISYNELLEIYWLAIDPTDDGGQFVDRGYVYTTAVYYHYEDQRQIAVASAESLRQERGYTEPVATELVPFTTFYPAEEYHQDYYKKSSDRYKRYESGSGRQQYKDSLQ